MNGDPMVVLRGHEMNCQPCEDRGRKNVPAVRDVMGTLMCEKCFSGSRREDQDPRQPQRRPHSISDPELPVRQSEMKARVQAEKMARRVAIIRLRQAKRRTAMKRLRQIEVELSGVLSQRERLSLQELIGQLAEGPASI